MDYYIKKSIPVQAKIFSPGDEDGFEEEHLEEWDDRERCIPYVHTLEGKILYGGYGEHYIIYGNHNDKWLVAKKIFEETYELITTPYTT